MLIWLPGKSQVGAGTLYIAAGTTFVADSLVLIPTVNTTITANTLTHDYVPISGVVPSTNSINRVYTWNTPITYSGEIGIMYDPSELAGNTAALLQIAYRNGGLWTTTATSTVSTNYVAYQATNITFNRVTATSAGIALPIVYAGFTASLKEQYVLLNWKMADVDGLSKFEIEYSTDARNWTVASSVTPATGTMDFSYQHNDLNFTSRYYRVAGVDYNGNRVYTRMAIVSNNNAVAGIRIIRSGNNTTLYFSGKAPTNVQLYDMKGQLLLTRNVVAQQVEITGQIPGTYVIYYVVDGQKLSRKIQL
ncbi:hypothetical protein [Paraflavitalea speifideaquila]|uniref:hypothetical protein n=1 Tax=Paraflavitalea speifideaquila TaxID=3076558 RepID=UPI0028EFEF7F|nr:hypothetical protein [Paraflavitalea speifideiaquila]